MIGDAGVALLVELVADRADPAVHHVARRDRVGAGLGVGDRGFRQQLDGEVVVDLAVADEAAVAVRGVLAEADVGDHGQVRVGLLQRPDRHLHDLHSADPDFRGAVKLPARLNGKIRVQYDFGPWSGACRREGKWLGEKSAKAKLLNSVTTHGVVFGLAIGGSAVAVLPEPITNPGGGIG